MKTRRLEVRFAMLGWAAWAMAVSAVATRADSLVVSPTSEGIRSIVNVMQTFTPGPFPPPNSFLSSSFGVDTLTDSALKFDITSIATIPQGAVITSATFSLSIAGSLGPGTTGPSQNISGYGDNVGMVALSDFSEPTTAIGNTGSLPANAPPGSLDIPLSFDATSFVQSLVNTRTDFAGFRLDPGFGPGSVFDWSAESADPARRPSLTINFSAVPEPSAALLMGFGLAGVVAVAWRRGTRR
jgi:hypothetical protein